MMNRRTFAIAVRVLAVLAAIYTFFTFRSQLADQRQSPQGKAIPAKVVSRETACGWVTVTSSSGPGETVALDQTRTLLAAIQNPGQRMAVRDQDECGRLIKLNGSVISSDQGVVKIDFREAR